MRRSARASSVGRSTTHLSKGTNTVEPMTEMSRPTRPERDVIRHAQQGDARAFTVLYEAHKRHVYGLCFRMTRSRELAEELTQETFLQVFRKLTSYRGDAAFSTWL